MAALLLLLLCAQLRLSTAAGRRIHADDVRFVNPSLSAVHHHPTETALSDSGNSHRVDGSASASFNHDDLLSADTDGSADRIQARGVAKRPMVALVVG